MTATDTATDPTLAGLHAPFLRTIIDRPLEDGPRLVYCDYLEEQGDGDRAEFIRVQINPMGTTIVPCRCAGYTDDPENPWHGQPGHRPERDPASGRHEGGWTNCKTCNAGGKAQVRPGFLRQMNSDRATALLVLHERTWTADVRAVLPKCERCVSLSPLHDHLGNPMVCPECKDTGHDPAFSLTWDRGFIGGISGPSAGLWDAVCRPCGGGGERVVNMRTPPRKCQECKGEGRTPSILPALVRVAPLVSATATDREPRGGPTVGAYGWWDARQDPDGHDQDNILGEIWDRLDSNDWIISDHFKWFPTAALAHAALSIASLNHYRALAELPLLESE